MPAPQRIKVLSLLEFNPDSAGGLMNVDMVFCAKMRQQGGPCPYRRRPCGKPEALLQMHVLNENGQLAGAVSVITLLQAHAADAVAALMDSNPVRVTPDADLADIAVLMADYNLHIIPVVDLEDQVLGVVTVDDVLKTTIPDEWSRREPGRRPVRESGSVSGDSTSVGSEGGDWR